MAGKNRGTWASKQDRLVKKLIGNYPIVDAKVAFRNIVLPQDIKGAGQKNPHHCALARSISRHTGLVKGIAVFHHIAYAPFDKNGDGKITIERFCLDRGTKQAVEKFDRTGEFAPGEYVFLPPPKSLRIDAQKKASAKHRRKVKKTGWNRRPRNSMLGVRNGTGKSRAA